MPFAAAILCARVAMVTAFDFPAVANAADLVPSTQPAQLEAAESAFREGLRRRGLDEWLEQYLADAPPVSEVDEQLRQRERLLAEADRGDPRARGRKVEAASAILEHLIETQSHHPSSGRWQLELARDQLERQFPGLFDAVLLYELRVDARDFIPLAADQSARQLTQLREQIAASWKTLEALDERKMAEAIASGVTRELEALDGESQFLLTWASFYQTLDPELTEDQRRSALDGLLENVTQRYGWTAPVPGREIQRCSALLMAAMASRWTGRFADARQYARDIQEAVSEVKDPAARQGLSKLVLLAVLEQIRSPRDAGKLDEAREVLVEARAWAKRSRPGDVTAALALAFAERSILVRQVGSADATSGEDLLQPPEGLLPLQQVAAESPAARDALYEAAMTAELQLSKEGLQSPFAVQLFCGAKIANLGHFSQSEFLNQVGSVAITLTDALHSPTLAVTPETRGELMFLLARAHYLSEAPLEAARTLCELAEALPDHDRSEAAVEQAVALSQEALRKGDAAAKDSARATFVRAGRLLRKRAPGSPAARQLQYFIAAALDESQQYLEAAEEYAAVASDDPRALRASWGRARCLRDALNQAPTTRPEDAPTVRKLGEQAVAAAKAAWQLAEKTDDAEACLAAEIKLTLVGLLNHAQVGRAGDALAALDGFETRHAACPASLVPALRERVSALRQLKRMSEAREVMEKYLAADPDNAGPLMARLLDAMRQEIESAADRGDDTARRATAQEAAILAERLSAWSTGHPGRMSSADDLTVAVWQAWATLEAGHPETAMRLYARLEEGRALTPDSPLRAEIRLGRAEGLLRTGKPAEALPFFTAAWQQSPEDSSHWWRALAGTLAAHTALGHDPAQIVQSIRQQRQLHPAMGAARWKRELERLEQQNLATVASRPG